MFKILSDYRQELMGLSAILIIVYHLGLCEFFNIGVEFFLILSGIGCHYSLSKDSNVLSFYHKRFVRVVPVFFLVAIPYYFYHYFFCDPRWIWSFYSFGLGVFIGRAQFWFIPLIFACYMISPFVHAYLKKTKHPIAFCIVVLAVSNFIAYMWSSAYIFFCRVPIYVFGMYLPYLKSDNSTKSWGGQLFPLVTLIILISITLYLIRIGYSWQIVFILYSVISIPLLVRISGLLNSTIKNGCVKKCLSFMGSISLETYLVQEVFAFNVAHYITDNTIAFIILSSAITVATAFLLKHFVAWVRGVI